MRAALILCVVVTLGAAASSTFLWVTVQKRERDRETQRTEDREQLNTALRATHLLAVLGREFELSTELGTLQFDRSTGLAYTLSKSEFVADGLRIGGAVSNIGNPDMSNVTLRFDLEDELGWANRDPVDGGLLMTDKVPPSFRKIATGQAPPIPSLPSRRSANFLVLIPKVAPETMKGAVLRVTPTGEQYETLPVVGRPQ